MRQWFTTKKEEIFNQVEVLIYVFDIEKEGEKFDEDMRDYSLCVQNLKQLSPEAKVFILIHKLDRIPEHQKENVLSQKREVIMEASKGRSLKLY